MVDLMSARSALISKKSSDEQSNERRRACRTHAPVGAHVYAVRIEPSEQHDRDGSAGTSRAVGARAQAPVAAPTRRAGAGSRGPGRMPPARSCTARRAQTSPRLRPLRRPRPCRTRRARGRGAHRGHAWKPGGGKRAGAAARCLASVGQQRARVRLHRPAGGSRAGSPGGVERPRPRGVPFGACTVAIACRLRPTVLGVVGPQRTRVIWVTHNTPPPRAPPALSRAARRLLVRRDRSATRATFRRGGRSEARAHADHRPPRVHAFHSENATGAPRARARAPEECHGSPSSGLAARAADVGRAAVAARRRWLPAGTAAPRSRQRWRRVFLVAACRAGNTIAAEEPRVRAGAWVAREHHLRRRRSFGPRGARPVANERRSFLALTRARESAIGLPRMAMSTMKSVTSDHRRRA